MKTQKELKAQYLQELESNSTWAKEPTMITYCYNKASVIVELDKGKPELSENSESIRQ